MALTRLMDDQADEIEEQVESAELAQGANENILRPKNFENYIGQENLKTNLKLAIQAAKGRGEAIDHVLLYGPPGLGKTTMAVVIAAEMGAHLHITAGPAIERSADLASLLTKLQPGDVLFIDEIHRLSKNIEEVLYSAMEDFGLDIMLGKGPSARSMRIDLPQFTLIGATTKTGSIAGPLRDRFGMIHQLEFYTEGEIEQILKRSSGILNTKLDDEAAALISTRARLTPRIANRLLKRVRDYAQVHHSSESGISVVAADGALKLLKVDELGLDASDIRLLKVMRDNFGGGPVGLDTLAAATAEDKNTIEDYYEPYLLRIGFLERTPRGRKLTAKAEKWLEN